MCYGWMYSSQIMISVLPEMTQFNTCACRCMYPLTVDCAGSPGLSLSVQAAVWTCGGSVVCLTGERLLCEPPASGCSGTCWRPASPAEDHTAAPRFFFSCLTDAQCLCCCGRQEKRTVNQEEQTDRWEGSFCEITNSLQWYLRCRMCESSISRWASRMDCCWEDKPVLEMLQTRASVTESSSLRTFPRLSTSSGVCDKLEQLSVNKHNTGWDLMWLKNIVHFVIILLNKGYNLDNLFTGSEICCFNPTKPDIWNNV